MPTFNFTVYSTAKWSPTVLRLAEPIHLLSLSANTARDGVRYARYIYVRGLNQIKRYLPTVYTFIVCLVHQKIRSEIMFTSGVEILLMEKFMEY